MAESRTTYYSIISNEVNIKSKFIDKDRIDKGNDNNHVKLEVIDRRLMDEFIKQKNRNMKNIWKLIL